MANVNTFKMHRDVENARENGKWQLGFNEFYNQKKIKQGVKFSV